MLLYCCILTCENFTGRSISDGIAFFRQPQDHNRKKIWIDEIKKHQKCDQHFYICQLHFEKESFYCSQNTSKKPRLKSNGMPTIFKPNPNGQPFNESSEVTMELDPLLSHNETESNVVLLNDEHYDIQSNEMVNVEQNNGQQSSKKCHRCINLEAEFQAQQMKINERDEIIDQLRAELTQCEIKLEKLTSDYVRELESVKCSVCKKKYMASDDNHICNGANEIYCEYCGELFKSTRDHIKHLSTKHNSKKFLKREAKILDDIPIGEITEAHTTKTNLIEQKIPTKRKNIKTNISFECYICKIILASRSEIRRHLKLHLLARDKKCEICEESLTANEMDWHVCESAMTIECELCEASFRSTLNLSQHLENAHGDRTLHRCRKCPRYFGMAKLRIIHEKKHTNEAKLFVCDQCSKGFLHKHLLRTHLYSHSDQRNFLCSECGKGFRNAVGLRIHCLTHGEKTIQCPDCPATYARESDLRIHQEVHKNLKYPCNECDVVRSTRKALSLHIRDKHKAEKDKPFACTFCELKFASRHRLVFHMKVHSKEKPYGCEYCPCKYKYKGDLTKHLQTHVGDNIYTCKRCDEGFRLHSEFKKHSYVHYKEDKQKSEAK